MISDFSNIKKVCKKINLFIFVMTIFLLGGCSSKGRKDENINIKSKEIVEQNSQYAIYLIPDDKYLVEIYDTENYVIYREILYRLPQITLYDNRFLEIKWGAGLGVWNCRYLDLSERFISESYVCARYVKDGIIALMIDTDVRKINLFVPFSYSEFNREIILDFNNSCANSSDCLVSVEANDNNQITIEYINESDEIVKYTGLFIE